ncbi:Epidermal growth factor-binding protein type B [Mactra antiquata]
MRLLLCICVTEFWILFVKSSENYDAPRSYELYTEKKTWSESEEICRTNGGHLAVLYDYSTIPDMGLQQYFHDYYTSFWIGLYFNHSMDKYTWVNDEHFLWSNWNDHDERRIEINNSTSVCVMATVVKPYDWLPIDCSEKHYFVCQYAGGKCRFVKSEDWAIISHDYLHMSQQTADDCKHICTGRLSRTCKSFEHFPTDGRCQFSTGNRWTLSDYFRSSPGWVYYHRTCNIGGVAKISPTLTVTPCLQTTSVFLTPDVETVTVTTSESLFVTKQYTETTEIYITQMVTMTTTILATTTTTQILSITPSFPILPSEILDQQPIEQLQEMGEVAKQKQKNMKKISMEDKRPSARYVGYIAVLFLSIVFGSLVLFDLLTLFRNKSLCCGKSKKNKSKQTSPKTERNFTSLPSDSRSELTDDLHEETESNIQLDHQNNINNDKKCKTRVVHHKAKLHWRPLVWTVNVNGMRSDTYTPSSNDENNESGIVSSSSDEQSGWRYHSLDLKGDNLEQNIDNQISPKRDCTTRL